MLLMPKETQKSEGKMAPGKEFEPQFTGKRRSKVGFAHFQKLVRFSMIFQKKFIICLRHGFQN